MGKQTKRRWKLPELTTKAKIGFGLVVLVFGGAIAVYIVTAGLAGKLGGSESFDVRQIRRDLEAKETTARKDAAASTAYDALTGGESGKAGTIYEQAIAVEPDPTGKVRLAIDYSRILNSQRKGDEALRVAEEAESYSDDKYLISDWLGQLYELNKRYDDAIKYYTQAGERTDSVTNDKGFDKQFYDSKVIRLKALAEKDT